MPLACPYVSVSCIHERVCANTSSPLLSNMLFRCLHHIVGMMDRPYNLEKNIHLQPGLHQPTAETVYQVDPLAYWNFPLVVALSYISYVKEICQGALTNDVLMNCNSQCTKMR